MGPQPNSCGNRVPLHTRGTAGRASMGPQPNSCGNHRSAPRVILQASCFNGATAKQLWKLKALAAANLICFCFNGATAKQLWKPAYVETLRPITDASMGPQPNSCGNTLAARAGRASPWLQWGHSQTAVETDCEGSQSLAGPSALQWGHSQTAVETRPSHLEQDIFHLASMGPQPNSCGNMPRPVNRIAAPSRFNGATAKQLWKRRHNLSVVERIVASMGPQPNSCGNASAEIAARKGHTLQWGHSQTAVETDRVGRQTRADHFGLQWGHSQTAVETCRRVPGRGWESPRASMGPQPNSCGNGIPLSARCVPRSRFNGATAKQLWKRRGARFRACA